MRRWRTALALAILLALLTSASALAAISVPRKSGTAPILFGLVTPLSGTLAFAGAQEVDGAKLALAQLNAKGGVLGHTIKLAVQDDACNPTDAVTAGNDLIDQHPLVMLGFSCSSATLAGMPLVERAQIPLISGISTSPDIPAESGVGGNKWVFTLTPTDATFATALARFFRLQKVHSIAIVAENTDYGRGGAEAMTARAKAFGMVVTSTNYYTQGTSDFTALLASLKSQSPQRVAYWGTAADDANFSRQFAQTFQGTSTLLSGRPELTGPDTPTVQTGALSGATSAEQYTYTINTPANRTFVAAFEKAYGTPPITQSFEGYQEVMLAANAAQKAQKLTPQAVRNELATIKFQSMLAPAHKATLYFDKYQQAHDRAVIAIVRGTKVVLQALIAT